MNQKPTPERLAYRQKQLAELAKGFARPRTCNAARGAAEASQEVREDSARENCQYQDIVVLQATPSARGQGTPCQASLCSTGSGCLRQILAVLELVAVCPRILCENTTRQRANRPSEYMC
jgi:hypothetical protein